MPILIVEDDAIMRETLVMALRLHGYNATAVCNGLAALEHLISADPLPNLILLDNSMPVMDGPMFRIVQLANPEIAQIPVVVMSAAPNILALQQQLGAVAALAKPIDVISLVATVQQFAT